MCEKNLLILPLFLLLATFNVKADIPASDDLTDETLVYHLPAKSTFTLKRDIKVLARERKVYFADGKVTSNKVSAKKTAILVFASESEDARIFKASDKPLTVIGARFNREELRIEILLDSKVIPMFTTPTYSKIGEFKEAIREYFDLAVAPPVEVKPYQFQFSTEDDA